MQNPNDLNFEDVKNLIDSVSEATDGKYQADTIVFADNPDAWEDELDENGNPTGYAVPTGKPSVLDGVKKINVKTTPMSIYDFLLTKQAKRMMRHDYLNPNAFKEQNRGPQRKGKRR